jgi:hypothetical protein
MSLGWLLQLGLSYTIAGHINEPSDRFAKEIAL